MQNKRVIHRRTHSREFKAEVLAACSAPGASVAAVGLAHGLNANLVHRWLRYAAARAQALLHTEVCVAPAPYGEFIAVPLPLPLPLPLPITAAVIPVTPPASAPDIRIELHRGATTVHVHWPLQGASECAVWLREWLR